MKEDDYFYKKLGYILKAIRRKENISLKSIAEELNVSIQQIHKYEKGINKIPVDKLGKYCKMANISLDKMVAWVHIIRVIE